MGPDRARHVRFAGRLNLEHKLRRCGRSHFSGASGANLSVLENGSTLNYASAGISNIVVYFNPLQNNTFNFNGPITVSISFQWYGNTDTLNVNSGTFGFPAPIPGSGTSVVSLETLAIAANAKATLGASNSPTDRTVLELNSLSAVGGLDLTTNDLIVIGAGSSGLATITNQIKSGENQSGTPWAGGSGITSSAAVDSLHRFALGVIQNIDLAGHPVYGATTAFGPFDDQTPGTNDVLVKFTYYGDSDLNGKVDAADYSHIDNGANSAGTLSGWVNGDFNYDGVINGAGLYVD